MKLKQIFTTLFLFVLPISSYALETKTVVDRSIRTSGDVLSCTIDDVDDGDTVDLLCGEKIIPSVRLLGVNTPDIIMPENEKHCFYDEARGVMRKIKNNARKLTVQFYGSDLCVDRYKGCRNLVRLTDEETDLDVNERLIESGYAFEWTDFSTVPLKIKARYRMAEKRARENQSGLWGKCIINYSYSKLDSSVPDKMTW